MNNYIKLNEDRWNNVKNDYTEPLRHEELEKVKNNIKSFIFKWKWFCHIALNCIDF